ncbi:hypothetical protein HETIRDRAFT_119090 [Heterobasidion irregulare TC 32-1]|uniref:DUF6534 domain-containing protein n=1 Tax=Heterobasidion irregulare (strain TC 32-1) TaxID=747525 RepID=W4JQD6_HETIT|nr:uncharacterized protein HETIRDRAFT_119090 [Heterobasidion irregulare TC 32-1]ETW75694.1 hypothetical protein HETIRDRAFT_119090 [Heterobasidion irregulare TC 32-1]
MRIPLAITTLMQDPSPREGERSWNETRGLSGVLEHEAQWRSSEHDRGEEASQLFSLERCARLPNPHPLFWPWMDDVSQINFARTIQGPIIVGAFLNLILYGVFLAQAHQYLSMFKRDRSWLKILIAYLVVGETVNSVFVMFYSYDRLVNHFAFGVDKLWSAVIICLFAFVACVGAIGVLVAATVAAPTPVDSANFRPIIILWLTFSVAADTMITVILCHHLQTHKTGFSETDNMINKIIQFTVQTGLITSLCAIIDLILYLTEKTGHHLIFNLPLAKLYTISLLSSLNSRQGWQLSSHVESNMDHMSGRKEACHLPTTTIGISFATVSELPERTVAHTGRLSMAGRRPAKNHQYKLGCTFAGDKFDSLTDFYYIKVWDDIRGIVHK